jgi:Na+/H+-translocating membrane pyrophosphatase
MLADWANTIVLLVSGAAVGILGVVSMLLAPASFEEAAHDWRKGEPLLKGFERRAQAQRKAIESGSPAFRLAGYAQMAVIAVVLLAVWLSPVSMGWSFAIGAVVGGVFAYAAFAAARRTPTPRHAAEPSGAAARADE